MQSSNNEPMDIDDLSGNTTWSPVSTWSSANAFLPETATQHPFIQPPFMKWVFVDIKFIGFGRHQKNVTRYYRFCLNDDDFDLTNAYFLLYDFCNGSMDSFPNQKAQVSKDIEHLIFDRLGYISQSNECLKALVDVERTHKRLLVQCGDHKLSCTITNLNVDHLRTKLMEKLLQSSTSPSASPSVSFDNSSYISSLSSSSSLPSSPSFPPPPPSSPSFPPQSSPTSSPPSPPSSPTSSSVINRRRSLRSYSGPIKNSFVLSTQPKPSSSSSIHPQNSPSYSNLSDSASEFVTVLLMCNE